MHLEKLTNAAAGMLEKLPLDKFIDDHLTVMVVNFIYLDGDIPNLTLMVYPILCFSNLISFALLGPSFCRIFSISVN